jgi:hypothetical protein
MDGVLFTREEVANLKAIVCAWVDEGHETPPYDDVLYALFEKLEIAPTDVTHYDIRPPNEATKV